MSLFYLILFLKVTDKKENWQYHAGNFVSQADEPLKKKYYIKETPLGEGGFGCVYKAQHKATREIRAIKEIKK